MKKIYITLLLLMVATIAMTYLYFSSLNTKTAANELALNAATANSAIVFSFDNEKGFYEIISKQDLFDQLLGKEKSNQLKAIKANLALATPIYTESKGQKIYISLLAGTTSDIDFLISLQTNAGIDLKKAIKHLNYTVKDTLGTALYQLNFKDSTSCFLAAKNKLILISSSANAIKNTLVNQKGNNQAFANYIKTNSLNDKNNLANLFLDFNALPILLKNILASNLTGELSLFAQQNAFAALRYNFSKEKLLFTGNTELKAANYYNLFSAMAEQKIFIDAILPHQTANYTLFAINDYVTWHKQLDKQRTLEAKQITQHIELIHQNYGLDLPKTFATYFNKQLVTFQLQSGDKLGAIALTNGEKVNQLFLDLSTAYSGSIRLFKEKKIPYYFFGEPFKKFEKPFFTIIDNYLLLANNASSLQVFLAAYQSNNLLSNDAEYINLKNQVSASASICFYVSNKNSIDIFRKQIKPTYFKAYQNNLNAKKFSSFFYQLSGENGKFITNLLLNNSLNKIIPLDSLKSY